MSLSPFVYLEDSLQGKVQHFRAPLRIIRAHQPSEVEVAFADMQQAHHQGKWLAGFASYELGYVLEPKLAHLLPENRAVPLLCFGVFDGHDGQALPEQGPGRIRDLKPMWRESDYAPAFAQVLSYIGAGDVYQINLTFPMQGRLEGQAIGLYQALKQRQPVAYGGMVALGDETLVSLSPELFFETQNRAIRAKPMKGTAPRGVSPAEDHEIARWLSRDPKQRAENLMIVDLLRNDLSRISEVGSVKVPDLFAVETYNTLHQMVSTIEAQLLPGLGLRDLFAGLFPCGSVTGAPKIRAMEIISELEPAPRGAYCGSIGAISPQGDMRFNVAIRTLTIGRDQSVTVNVGSGTVADSTSREEYAECLLKSRFLNLG